MKKLLSVMLAVVMLVSVGCLNASASEVNLFANNAVYSNDQTGANCTVTPGANGSFEAVVTKAWDSVTDSAYGFAIQPDLKGVDLTGMYVHLSITSDTPFRISQLDRADAGDKWISYSSEFFNSVIPVGVEGPGTEDMLVEGKFFPAGTYNCVAYLGGVYQWKTDNGEAGWDIKNANITAIYVEAMNAGTMKLNMMKLSTASEYSGTPAPTSAAPTTTAVNNAAVTTTTAANGTTAPQATTAATTSTQATAANVTTTTPPVDTDGAKTGEHSEVALILMIALVAGTVTVLSATAAKAKDR